MSLVKTKQSGMESANKGGKPPKLTDRDLQELKKHLEEKEYWQTREVKGLIKDKFNVYLSEDQIVRILREKLKMNFTPAVRYANKTISDGSQKT